MIGIIYTKGDFVAADIAMKIQAIAQNKRIYISPKHYGRDDNEIFKKISKCSIIIFLLATETKSLDKCTKKELEYIRKKKKELIVHYYQKSIAKYSICSLASIIYAFSNKR